MQAFPLPLLNKNVSPFQSFIVLGIQSAAVIYCPIKFLYKLQNLKRLQVGDLCSLPIVIKLCQKWSHVIGFATQHTDFKIALTSLYV